MRPYIPNSKVGDIGSELPHYYCNAHNPDPDSYPVEPGKDVTIVKEPVAPPPKKMMMKKAVPAEIPAKMAEAIPAVTAAEVLKAEATPAAAVLPPNQKIDSDKSGLSRPLFDTLRCTIKNRPHRKDAANISQFLEFPNSFNYIFRSEYGRSCYQNICPCLYERSGIF